MTRRRLQSPGLVVAAMLIGAPALAHVQGAAAPFPVSIPLFAVIVFGAVLWLRRLRAERDRAVDALRRLQAEDAGQQREVERALAVSERKLQEIISIMPMTLFIKDPHSRILMMNKAAEQQFGFDFSVVSGNEGHAMFPPEQMAVFLANDRAAFAGGRLVVQDELTYSHARNEDRQLQTLKKPIFDAVTGEPDFLICMSVDLTDRKRAEQALADSYIQLRRLMAHLEVAKDEEHRRLAAQIHDQLGQNLLALKIDIEMLHTRAGERHPHLRRKAGHALGTLAASIGSVRSIINELHPSILELGLAAALEWLVRQFETRSGIAATLSVTGAEAGAHDARRTAALFRIVQETLVDIVRHAQAMQVEVTLVFDAAQESITVADDGVACAERELGDGCGFGLRGIRERVEMVGGHMLVEPRAAGAGTCVSIVMPAAAGTVGAAGAAQPVS